MTINLDAPVSRPRSTPAIDLLEGERLLCRLPGDGPDRPFELFTVTPVGRTLGAEITGVDLREAPGPELP